MESEPDSLRTILTNLLKCLPPNHPFLESLIGQTRPVVRDYEQAQTLLTPVRPPFRREPPTSGLVAAFLLAWMPLLCWIPVL